MTLSQIWSFIKVVELKSFSKAAEEIFVNQSTLTKYIQALEEEVGKKLLARKGRDISMTPEGEIFLAFAVNIEKEYKDMIQKIAPNADKQVVAIAIPTFVELVSPYIDQYKIQNPDTDVILHEREQDELYEAARELNADIVFSWDHSLADFPQDYSLFPLFRTKLAVGMDGKNPLRQKETISLHELKDQHFVMFHQPVMRRFLLNKCRKYDFAPSIKYYVSGADTFYQYVRTGKGIAFMYDYDAGLLPPLIRDALDIASAKGVSIVKLEENITSDMSVIFRKKELSQAAISFVKYLAGIFECKTDLV